MTDQEQESIEPLKYQLKQWRELVTKYLPPTDCDRDDVVAIESLIKRATSNSALGGGLERELVLKVNPEKYYLVSYTIDQGGNVDYTPTQLLGKDLTEKQIVELYLKGEL